MIKKIHQLHMETVKLLGVRCVLEFGFYPNNTIAITAYRLSDNEPWCVPTVNWEEHFQGNDYVKKFIFPAVVIKDYNENEGAYQDLVTAGVVNHGAYLSGSGGFVHAVLLTDKWKAIAKKQLNL